ncbi:hypothetical protein JCM9492_04810 [Aquifex pyrophilus]
MRLLLLLLLISFTFPLTATYEVYLFFFKVGEIKVHVEKDKALAEGKTYETWRWLYDYNFKFIQRGKEITLYEREGRKEKVLKGEKVYEKKPWIPLIVEYLRDGKVRKSELFKVKEEKGRLVVIPLKSKRVKRVILYGKGVPKEILIEGKVSLNLKLKDARED